jgi:hypothetical protein
MKVRFDPSPLRLTRWHSHALRFAVGGMVTLATGLAAKAVGPTGGGLFLAFPAIFPIGVLLLERVENRKVGPGARGYHGRRAALVQSVGATMGAVGLTGFGVTAWGALDGLPAWLALGLAILSWASLAVATWWIRVRANGRLRSAGHPSGMRLP